MSAKADDLLVDGPRFAEELFQRAMDELVREATAGRIPVGKLAMQFALFRERGRELYAEAARLPLLTSDAEKTAWLILAKTRYSRKVEELFVAILKTWENRAPAHRRVFRKAMQEVIPSASLTEIFPEDVSITRHQREGLLGLFDVLAEAAGLLGGPAVLELQRAAFGRPTPTFPLPAP